MKIEHPAAFNFLLQDDLFLLDTDKAVYASAPAELIEVEKPKPLFNYLGGNKKNYLVITFYPDEEHITTPHHAALESTLKRLGYDMDDIAVLNLYYHKEISFDDMYLFFTPKKLLVLGNDALPAGLTTAGLNKINKTANHDTLLTYSFNEMMSDNDRKKAFWEQVKQL